ncbi:hypothetical protein FRC07_013023, partial [Ceratobasidium sp. 392]
DKGLEEMVALELAVRAAIAFGYSSSRIRVNSQSKATIQAFNGARSQAKSVHESVTRLRCLLEEWDNKVTCVEVTSENNRACAFSRGMVSKGYTKMPYEIHLPVTLMPWIDAIA